MYSIIFIATLSVDISFRFMNVLEVAEFGICGINQGSHIRLKYFAPLIV